MYCMLISGFEHTMEPIIDKYLPAHKTDTKETPCPSESLKLYV